MGERNFTFIFFTYQIITGSLFLDTVYLLKLLCRFGYKLSPIKQNLTEKFPAV